MMVLGLLTSLVLASCIAGAETSHEYASGAVYQGTELDGVAPDFRLVDHLGADVALTDFQGKVVVLAFMDTRCDETCPLTAFELRITYNSLGNLQEDVVFLGVNVNRNFNQPQDAVAFTAQHHLGEIPTWHFLTGDHEELEPVWEAYSIEVRTPDRADEEDFEHTPGVYIINQDGDLRWYVSTPLLEEGLVSPWTGSRLGEILARRIRELSE